MQSTPKHLSQFATKQNHKVFWLTQATINRMHKSAITKDTPVPISKISQSVKVCIASKCLIKSSNAAPIITGMPKKKENSVAALRDVPKSNAPIIVEPERLVPGINAKH